MLDAIENKPAKATLYQRVAERVRGLIEGGTLSSGDRIPSVRRMSAQMSVSISTVLEAYRLLEDDRVIEARPQSGYYVRPPQQTAPIPQKTQSCRVPTELEVDDLIIQVLADSQRPGVLPMGAAIPHPEFFPTARLNRILAQVVRADPETSHSYDTVPGLDALRVQIARRSLEAGLALTPDDLITTSGAQEALLLCLRATTVPGDTVVVETPTFHGLLEAIQSLHLRILEIGTDPVEGVCLIDLEEAITRKKVAACVFTPTFGNPLGHCVPEEKKKRLVELLARHEIPLIEDDVYGDIPFSSTRPKAAKAFDTDGNVLLCSSFSKTLAPGYRIGWTAPGRYRARVERLKFSTSVATATPTQMAVAKFLETGGFDRHLRKLRRTYRELIYHVSTAVEQSFPEGTKISRPEGGHILWVEMPGHVDSLEIYEQAIAEGISVAPGPIFSATGKYRNFLRLNCAMPWSPRVERAVSLVGGFVRDAAGERAS